MQSIDQIRKILAERLAHGYFLSNPPTLYQPIEYIMSIGGKRLRPILVLVASEMYGKPASEVLDVAIGIEVFHNFTLLHDDIMDSAPLRRGKETVHVKWDVNTAILSGDTMMVMAYDLIMNNNHQNLHEILRTFNQAAREVCEGQQFDMDFEKKLDVTLEEYMEMIRLKTSVLIAASLKIGALCAGAPKQDLDLLYHFGEKIGLAFQLKDDLLDVYGDTKTFGKETGNDIITNKKTYLLVKCLADSSANPEDRHLLLQWLHEHHKPQEKIKVIKTLYQKYGIEHQTNKAIETLYHQGLEFLRKSSLDEAQKAPLYEITDFLKARIS